MRYDVLVAESLQDLISMVNISISQGWIIEYGFFVVVGAKLVQYFQPMSFTPPPSPIPGLVIPAGESVEVFEDGTIKVKPKEDKA